MPPLHLVVELHCIRLPRRTLWRSSLRPGPPHNPQSEHHSQQNQNPPAHNRLLSIDGSILPAAQANKCYSSAKSKTPRRCHLNQLPLSQGGIVKRPACIIASAIVLIFVSLVQILISLGAVLASEM